MAKADRTRHLEPMGYPELTVEQLNAVDLRTTGPRSGRRGIVGSNGAKHD